MRRARTRAKPEEMDQILTSTEEGASKDCIVETLPSAPTALSGMETKKEAGREKRTRINYYYSCWRKKDFVDAQESDSCYSTWKSGITRSLEVTVTLRRLGRQCRLLEFAALPRLCVSVVAGCTKHGLYFGVDGGVVDFVGLPHLRLRPRSTVESCHADGIYF